jgi:hypothetical protein
MFLVFGDGIFTHEVAEWKHSRYIPRLQLQCTQYGSLDIFRDAVEDLIRVVEGSDGIVDLQPLFFRLTLDTTTAFLFGESPHSLATPEKVGERTFDNAFNTAQQWAITRYRLQDMYWLISSAALH